MTLLLNNFLLNGNCDFLCFFVPFNLSAQWFCNPPGWQESAAVFREWGNVHFNWFIFPGRGVFFMPRAGGLPAG